MMGVPLSFDEADILYRDFNSAPSLYEAAILYEELLNLPRVKQNIIVFAANNSMCCGCHVILWLGLLPKPLPSHWSLPLKVV